jgi:hypothetical protein
MHGAPSHCEIGRLKTGASLSEVVCVCAAGYTGDGTFCERKKKWRGVFTIDF